MTTNIHVSNPASDLTWKAKYSVGHPKIDAQHKSLFEIYNRLVMAFNECQGHQIIARTIIELIDYTRTHFADEESIMAQNDFSELDHHKVQHRMLLAKVEGLYRDLEDGDELLTYELLSFIRDWLQGHILEEDMKMAGDFQKLKLVKE